MPSIITRGAMSAKGFGFASLSASGYWIGLLGGAANQTARSLAVDSSGNVYVFGESTSSGAFSFQIAKYSTSGVIQWQQTLGGSVADIGYSVALDSSGNVYVCGSSFPSTQDIEIAKYNSSGAIQWQRKLAGTGQDYGRSITLDSSGNIYVSGYSNSSGTYDLQIAKCDTSGAIQWQRRLGGTGFINTGYGIALDSSGNIYVSGYSDASGTYDFLIAKYNSSGNVYACGLSQNTTDDLQIAKYDTSGAIQWQRRLGGSATDNGYGIALDSLGNIYVCGNSNASGAYDFLFARLPNNGSLTGTYTVGGYSFVYAASALTDAATTLTDAATSLTDAASSLTDSASTLTDAASTLTSSVTQI